MPYKVLDVGNVFLVGFGSKDNEGAPWTAAFINPVIVEQGDDVVHDDVGFVRAVVGFWTADWIGGAGVDAELEAQDRVPSAVLVETVPPLAPG
jgi:hypothetical protein